MPGGCSRNPRGRSPRRFGSCRFRFLAISTHRSVSRGHHALFLALRGKTEEGFGIDSNIS